MESIKRTAVAFGIALLLIPSIACRDKSASTSSSTSVGSPAPASGAATASPEELGRIGAAISKNPSDAKKILRDRGMTEESFEKAVRDVSSDPAASRRYRDGFRSARA